MLNCLMRVIRTSRRFMIVLKTWTKSMRNKNLYLIVFVLLASSCSREKAVSVIIHPLQINFYADISELREQLKERNTTLVYENSYEGEQRGIQLFYFDAEND